MRNRKTGLKNPCDFKVKFLNKKRDFNFYDYNEKQSIPFAEKDWQKKKFLLIGESSFLYAWDMDNGTDYKSSMYTRLDDNIKIYVGGEVVKTGTVQDLDDYRKEKKLTGGRLLFAYEVNSKSIYLFELNASNLFAFNIFYNKLKEEHGKNVQPDFCVSSFFENDTDNKKVSKNLPLFSAYNCENKKYIEESEEKEQIIREYILVKTGKKKTID